MRGQFFVGAHDVTHQPAVQKRQEAFARDGPTFLETFPDVDHIRREASMLLFVVAGVVAVKFKIPVFFHQRRREPPQTAA